MELTKTNPQFIRLPCLESRADDEAKDEALVPCKRRKKEKNILYLPREIILFNIFVRIPGEVLHDTVRYVCKQWFEIVRDADFVRLRQISPAGFLIPHYFPHYYIDADTTARLKVTKVIIPAAAKMLCCHNNLVLLSDSTNKEIFLVVNLVTKVIISLPPLVSLRKYPENVGFAIDSSGYYKVVYVSGKIESYEQEVHMSVFTIGVDKAWRFIDLQGIPISAAAKSSMLLSRLDCFGGFIYWLRIRNCYLGLALDVNTETIYEFSKPNDLVDPYCVIGIGTGVGLIDRPNILTWRIWKLNDVKSGQWTELAYIDMRKLYNQFGFHLEITPVRLLRGDLWFYREESIVVRYNMSNKSFEAFLIKTSRLHPSSSKHMVFTQELLASPDVIRIN